jgi:hypothetical protein
MSTRGTGIFEIKDRVTGKTDNVAEIHIPRDAYPSWFGQHMCDIISYMIITQEPIGENPEGNLAPNVERVILNIVNRYEPNYFKDDEYVYRFTFTTPDPSVAVTPASELVRITVTQHYSDEKFEGSFEEFEKYCRQ